MSAAATMLPPAAGSTEVLSKGLDTIPADIFADTQNWATSKEVVLPFVNGLKARIAQLEAAAKEYVSAVNGDIELDGTPDGLRRLQRAETALLGVLP